MSTIKVNKIENTATADGGVAIDTDGHVTIDGQQLPTAGPLSNRNMIINGKFNVAQRSTSENVAAGDNGYLTVDRWLFDTSGLDDWAGVVKQQAITDLPGFKTAFRVDTNTTAESTLDSNDRMLLYQEVEAQNVQHLMYGTSSAQTITLSFWVQASVTGDFALGLYNSDQNKILGSTYSIQAADTWEYKTVTFTGDPAGNINNDNGAGLRWQFTIAAGSDYNATDNTSWGIYSAPKLCFGHNQNGVVTNIDGYWQVTGCQMEIGTKSTPFEHRSYGDELAKCQRYYYEVCDPNYSSEGIGTGEFWDNSSSYVHVGFPTTMRALPTFSGFTAGNGPGYVITYGNNTVGYSNDSGSIVGLQRAGANGAMIYTTQFVTTSSGVGGSVVTFPQGYASWMEKRSSDLRINFNAEL
jgi:hypothetical protein